MRYKGAFACVSCKTILSFDKRHYNKGVCPYCGKVNRTSSVHAKVEIFVLKRKSWRDWWRWEIMNEDTSNR